jgi:hypothetical protein
VTSVWLKNCTVVIGTESKVVAHDMKICHIALRLIELWLQGPAQGFVKCELSPEPYEADSRARLGSGF